MGQLEPTPSTGPSIMIVRSVDNVTIMTQAHAEELKCDQLSVCESDMGYVIHAWDLFGGDAQRIRAEPRLISKMVLIGKCDGLRWRDQFAHGVLDFGEVVLHLHARPGENLRVDEGPLEAADLRSMEVTVRTLELSVTDLERMLAEREGEGDDVQESLAQARDRLRRRLSELQKDLFRRSDQAKPPPEVP